MPLSFFALTIAMAEDDFTIAVARHVDYPESGGVSAMFSASYYLVPFGTNDIGLSDSFSFCPG